MYRFKAPDKQRPVLVLSRQVAIDHLNTVIVAPITSTIRGLPSEVLLGIDDGLKKPSAANLDHLLTVSQADLKKFISHLEGARMQQACRAAAIALGCV